MKNNERFIAVIIVLAVAWLIVNPAVWFTFIGVIVEVGVFCLVAKIVARIIFGKSLKELIFDRKED